MFSELDELSGGREGGASTQAPDDVPSFSPNLNIAQGTASPYATTHSLQLLLEERLIHSRDPVW